MPRDYYDVLGVSRTASAEQLQKAYRTLARRNHPDVNKDPAAEERFKEVNEAYHVLADPATRARYDSVGPDLRRVGERADGPAGGRGSAGFDRSGRGGVDLDDLFGDLFGGGSYGGGSYGGGRTWLAGADQEAELPLSLMEAYAGGRRTIGLAAREYDVTIPPGVLDGQRIRLSGQGGRGHGDGAPGDLYLVARILPHPRFRLEGRDISVRLPVSAWEAALGATVPVPVPSPGGEATVVVPAGSSTGRRLRLRGQGMPNPRGTPGDLYAEVAVMVAASATDAERDLFERLSKVSSFDPRKSDARAGGRR